VEEHDWGEVLEWDPPRRLAYRWHLRQDHENATRVEISFAPAAEGTAVTIVHTDWQRLGQRERNERGWAAWCRTTSPPVQPVRTRRPKFGPAAGRSTGARAVACALMEKPKTTAPPRHRRYPRGTPKAAESEKAEISRRWPRSIPDRRVFPRG